MSARNEGNDASNSSRELENAARWASLCLAFGLTRARQPFDKTPVGELCWRIYSEVAGRTFEILATESDGESLLRSARMTLEADDRYLGMLPFEMPFDGKRLTLACRKGCAHCCSIRITTTAPFVLLMEEAIRGRNESFATALTKRIQQYRSLRRSATFVPCPLLSGDVCTFYDSRPASCRGCHSFDVLECAKPHHSQIPQSAMRQMVHFAVTVGYDDALRVLGFDVMELEFVPALEIAMQEPRCLERWMEGEAVFAPARREQGGKVAGSRFLV